eukprot:SAG31_NODE_1260_length_9073_cov_2.761088_2_plen_247_part_00
MKVVDTDDSGRIEYSEFSRLWKLMEQESALEVGRVIPTAVPAFEGAAMLRGGGGAEYALDKLLQPKLADQSNAARQLRDAARRGDMPAVRALLDSARVPNIDEGEAQRDYETALLLAAEAGHVSVVSALLAAGAEPDLANPAGWTALHRAAMWGHADVAAALVRGGGIATSLKPPWPDPSSDRLRLWELGCRRVSRQRRSPRCIRHGWDEHRRLKGAEGSVIFCTRNIATTLQISFGKNHRFFTKL